MTNALRIYRDTVALEAGIITSNIGDLVRNVIPNITHELTKFVDNFLPSDKAITLTTKQVNFITKIKKEQHLDIVSLLAYQPEGLKVSYLEYSVPLSESVNHISSIINNTLSKYTVLLSQLVSNEDSKLSTQSLHNFYTDLAINRERLIKDMALCFERGSTKAENNYGNVVHRAAEWSAIFNVCNDITKKINTVDRKILNKKINECTELLEIISIKVKNNEYSKMSSQQIQNIADGAYQVASELEFYSIVYYRVLAYVETINHTVDHVTKALKL